MNSNQKCKEKMKKTKVLGKHTINLLKDEEIEEEVLLDEICNNLEE